MACCHAFGSPTGSPLARQTPTVAAGREVAKRIVLAEQLEQAADRRFVLARERVLGTLRLKQHDRGDHQCDRAEEAEQRIDEDMWVAAE